MKKDNNRPCPFCGEIEICNEYKKQDYPEVLQGFKVSSSMKKCSGCKSLYLNHTPTRDELSELYSQHFTYSDKYSRKTIDQYKKQLSTLLNLGTQKTAKLLEIGCAGGNWLLASKEMGWDTEGNDLNREMLERVSKEVGVQTHHGFFEDINLPNEGYDIVIAMNVFEHLVEPDALIRKLSKVLKPGGLFFMKTPMANSMSERFEAEEWVQLHNLGHILFGSKRAIEDIFNKHGFQCVLHRYAGFPPKIFSFMMRRKKVQKITLMVESEGATNESIESVESLTMGPKNTIRHFFANSHMVKPIYYWLLNLFKVGDSSYWVFKNK